MGIGETGSLVGRHVRIQDDDVLADRDGQIARVYEDPPAGAMFTMIVFQDGGSDLVAMGDECVLLGEEEGLVAWITEGLSR